jgi:oxalate decarboxylase/phosphoglucose isomerase-like protein (cupin superfamily)
VQLKIETFNESAAPRVDTYQEWQKAQAIPVVGGFYVPDIKTLELFPWKLKGAAGSFIRLDGAGKATDAYVCEIPRGGKLKPQRHLYEEMVYIASGRGATAVWQNNGERRVFEWQAGSLFAVPLNASYQHFNGSGTEPARYLAVTNAPLMMNLFHNADFIFANDFRFTDRFDAADRDFFSGARLYGRSWMSVNFVPDTHSLLLGEQNERGPGARNMKFDLAGQVMCAHISEFAVGTYKKAHFHGPGAHVLILSGQGYSLLWRQQENTRSRVDWRPGSLIVPPELWLHQHFNSGAQPARYLALRWNNWHFPFLRMVEGSRRQSIRQGGTQLEYADEDPQIHQEFETALTEAGASCRMAGTHPFCTHAASART